MSPGAPDDSAYRPCAAIVLFAADGRVLVGERIDVAEPAWQLPQGGIDDGESPADAALRELREEMGTARAAAIGESVHWHRYDIPAAVAANPWHGRWRGQRVKGVALRFTGVDADIDLATGDPEFRAWKWVALEDLPALIVGFKKPLYEALVREFAPLRDRLIHTVNRLSCGR
jgi:putative (di)nucleoside polyphosphate hydrolase